MLESRDRDVCYPPLPGTGFPPIHGGNDGVVRIYDFFNGLLSGLDPKDGVL
jgi:hypothetical protein